MTTQQETRQAEALQAIIDEAVLNAYVGMLQSDVIRQALADGPRMMTALGADRFEDVDECGCSLAGGVRHAMWVGKDWQ